MHNLMQIAMAIIQNSLSFAWLSVKLSFSVQVVGAFAAVLDFVSRYGLTDKLCSCKLFSLEDVVGFCS